MMNRSWYGSGLILLGVTFVTLLAGDAFAQYGGQPTGSIFSPPKDVRNSFSAQRSATADPTAASGDPYDPNVWLARRPAGRSRRGSAHAPARTRTSRRAQLASHAQRQPAETVVPPTVVAPEIEGDVTYEYGNSPYNSGPGHPGSGCSDCGDGGCGSDGCNSCCEVRMCCLPCPQAEHFDLFVGVHGFKGPVDGGINGNFGFQEGFNISGPIGLGIFRCYDLAYQVGWQAVQSDLTGTYFSEDHRSQYFLTAGVFHRTDCGIQWGLVWDWLREEHLDNFDVNQIRGEISLINHKRRELGFSFAASTDKDTAETYQVVWQSTDQYVFFHRWSFCNGSNARLWGGFTGSKDGIFGGDADLPLCDRWSIAAGWNYLIPEEGRGQGGAMNESWNVGINLVWHLGRGACNRQCSLSRPMFNVADNGSLMIERRSGNLPGININN